MNRRGFLQSILAAGVAPYVVTTAGVLMPVRQILVPSRMEFHPSVAKAWARFDSGGALIDGYNVACVTSGHPYDIRFETTFDGIKNIAVFGDS